MTSIDILGGFPRFDHTEGMFSDICRSEDAIGVDFEFNPDRKSKNYLQPTIVGVANHEVACALPWHNRLGDYLIDAGELGKLVAYSTCDADKPVLEHALGIDTPLEWWDDAMLKWYLCNSDLVKINTKESDEGDAEGGLLGLMGLWTAVSYYRDIPCWKHHREPKCDGPCPSCEVFDYCATDAWAGLVVDQECDKRMKALGIPHKLYWDLMERTHLAHLMNEQGFAMDVDKVRDLDAGLKGKKEAFFPSHMEDRIGKRGQKLKHQAVVWDTLFNPSSPQQTVAYFGSKGIKLRDTQKGTVRTVLVRRLAAQGVGFEQVEDGSVELEGDMDLLWRLYMWKSAGKGLKAWVGGLGV